MKFGVYLSIACFVICLEVELLAQSASEEDWIALLGTLEQRVPSHKGKWKLTRIWPENPEAAQAELKELEDGLTDPALKEDYEAAEEIMRRRAQQRKEGYTDIFDVDLVHHSFRKYGITKKPIDSEIASQYFANDEGVIYYFDGGSVTLLLDRGQLIRQLGAGISEYAVGELFSDIQALKVLELNEETILIGFRCAKGLVNVSLLREGLVLQSIKCGLPSDFSPDDTGSEFKSISFEIAFEDFTQDSPFKVPRRSIKKVFNGDGSLYNTEIWELVELEQSDGRILPSVEYTIPNGVMIYDRLGQELRVYKSDEILPKPPPRREK